VVPVLVHDAVMPTAQELPDVLKELAFRNGTELTHARWDSDVKLLIEDLRPYLEAPGIPVAPAQTTGKRSSDAMACGSQSAVRHPGSRSLWVAAGAVVTVVGVALSGYYLARDRPATTERSATVEPDSPVAPPATAAVRKPEVTTAKPLAAVKPVTPAVDEHAKPDPAAAQAEATKLAADKAAADAVQAAAKAAAARKLAEDKRRREEAARLAQLAEEQRKADEQRKRDEDNKRLADELRKRDEENKRLAQERAERERIAAEQAAAASFITGIASAFIANKQNNRR
jgi:type IV secretory pathway VirB10-like protein